jgi:hypothetical protein
LCLVKPKTNQVPSYHWLQGGIQHLVKSCIFYHSAFSLSRHDTSRIAATVDYLYQEGRLTKDPSWQKNWVGTFLVRRLVTALIEDALKNGTINWDVVMSKALSIVMVAALASRAGDVTVAQLDGQTLPFLCYNDITIKLKGGRAVEDLEAQVVIRNEKGAK